MKIDKHTRAKIRSPRDEGRHDEPIEWWYGCFHLADEGGNRYGVMTCFFNHGLLLLGITDESAKESHHAKRPYIPRMAKGRLDLRFGKNYFYKREDGCYDLYVKIGKHGVDMRLEPLKNLLLVNGGLVRLGEGYSHYYSQTRLEAAGTITVDGKARVVQGIGWIDRQWGDWGYDNAYDGYEWFAVQLDNGTELQIAWLYGKKLMAWAEFMDARGRTKRTDRVTIKARGRWQGSKSRNEYSSGWTVEIPDFKARLTITPTVRGQEFTSLAMSFWEGSCDVLGTLKGKPVTGRAFAELALKPRSRLVQWVFNRALRAYRRAYLIKKTWAGKLRM